MSLSEQCNMLLGTITSAQRQISTFENGTKVSATRARVNLSEASKQINTLRKSILEASKQIPIKAKKVKDVNDVVEPDVAPDAEPDNEALPEPLNLERKQTVVFEEPLIEPSKKPKSRAKPKPKAS